MLRLFLLLALVAGFVLAPLTARPPSAWADTPVDAGTLVVPAPVAVGSGSDEAVTPAPTTPAAKADEDPAGTVKQVVEDVKAGNWRFAVAGALSLLFVVGIRLRLKIFGTTDRGKAIAVMALAMLATFSSALATDTKITPSLIGGAIGVAFTAVGGRQWISRLLWPRDDGKHVAEWLQPWLGAKKGSDTAGATPPA